MNKSVFFAVSGVVIDGCGEMWVVNKSGCHSKRKVRNHESDESDEQRQTARQGRFSSRITRSRGETNFNHQATKIAKGCKQVEVGREGARTLSQIEKSGTTKLRKSLGTTSRMSDVALVDRL